MDEMKTVTVNGIEYGPVTKLDDLPRHDVVIKTLDGDRHKYPAILEQDLTRHCLVQSDEREHLDKTREFNGKLKDRNEALTARVAELEDKNRGLSNYQQAMCNSLRSYAVPDPTEVGESFRSLRAELHTTKQELQEIRKHAISVEEINKHLVAELATLREGQVLGEPCLYHELPMNKRYICRKKVYTSDQTDWQLGVYDGTGSGNDEGFFYWPWTEPTWTPPALPAPVEEVSEVPDFLRPQGLLGSITTKNHGIGYVVRIDLHDDRQYIIAVHLRAGSWQQLAFNLEDCTIYRRPVRHPDGTIAPIEPTPELLAALHGASDAQ